MLVGITIALTTTTFIANDTFHINLPKAEGNTTEGQSPTVKINQAGKVCPHVAKCNIASLCATLVRSFRHYKPKAVSSFGL
jgi:biopolymer transport protein ExbD